RTRPAKREACIGCSGEGKGGLPHRRSPRWTRLRGVRVRSRGRRLSYPRSVAAYPVPSCCHRGSDVPGTRPAAGAGRRAAQPAEAPKDKKDEKGLPVAALKPRLVGPAVTSGRVVGFAVNPRDRSHYFVAVASGGVWKTTNAGTTWAPVFDNEGSFSIGYVAMDPKNPSVVWVGTGENNSQRSVAYGDGVYKSTDGGRSWTNVGLKQSEHVG